MRAKAAVTYFGTGDTYLTGILAGTTDVDASTHSRARLAQTGSIAVLVAVTTILLGVASNTVLMAGTSRSPETGVLGAALPCFLELSWCWGHWPARHLVVLSLE
ncbi:DUF4010 domain-containing protein [Geothrix sp.]|uniref:DUF4010 domain-containing protein n=1 Tax=Geothrix sp. TaxID=1962974 RepID=UPI003BAE231B